VRLFLAVFPGEDFRAALSSRLDDAAGRLPLRWTRPETWHLTLQFLGEWPDQRRNALQAMLDATDAGEPFTLAPGGLGGFPDLRRPRVLFLHLEDDGRAAPLAAAVREATARAWPGGPQDTKAFRPHLTIARVRGDLDGATLKALRNIDLSGLPEIPVEGWSLVAADLQPGGARYREVAFWRVRKKGE
jgi:2'-5' RNA ligase